MISTYIAGKFRRPTGVVGRLVGYLMTRGNAYEAAWTVALLDIQPDDHVLELGFGPGLAIAHAARRATNGLVAGIDYAEAMVRAARTRNAAAMKAGRVDLRQGEVARLPYLDQSFDKTFSIHCIYFWANPIDDLKESRRILKPGGLLAVTIRPKETWPKERPAPPHLFTLYSGDQVAQLLEMAGFRDVRVEPCPQPDKFPGVCVLGFK